MNTVLAACRITQLRIHRNYPKQYYSVVIESLASPPLAIGDIASTATNVVDLHRDIVTHLCRLPAVKARSNTTTPWASLENTRDLTGYRINRFAVINEDAHVHAITEAIALMHDLGDLLALPRLAERNTVIAFRGVLEEKTVGFISQFVGFEDHEMHSANAAIVEACESAHRLLTHVVNQHFDNKPRKRHWDPKQEAINAAIADPRFASCFNKPGFFDVDRLPATDGFDDLDNPELDMRARQYDHLAKFAVDNNLPFPVSN